MSKCQIVYLLENVGTRWSDYTQYVTTWNFTLELYKLSIIMLELFQ